MEEARSGVVLHDRERSCPGLRLYTIQTSSRAELIDRDGKQVRSWTHQPSALWEHAELLEDGGLIVIGAESARSLRPVPAPFSIPDSARYVARLDASSRVVWKRRLNAHHDAEVQPDGRLAVLTFERRRIPAIHPDVDVRDDGITVLDLERGQALESWGFLDAVAGSEDVFPPDPGSIDELGGDPWVDLFHANSLEWMREENANHVLVCFRHQDRVAVFDASERRVVWSWGRGELSGPHDAQLLANGNVLVFDNGLARGWSRAVEVDPRTRRIVWQWRADPPEAFFTASKGSVQRLRNGNTLLAESDRGRAVEVAPDGEVVWHFVTPERSAPDRPLAIVRMRLIDAGTAARALLTQGVSGR